MDSNFSSIDWLIVASYIGVTVFLALRLRGAESGLADFLVAGRGIRTSLGVATMVGSELGLVTVVYSAQKGFTGGLAALHIPLVAGLVTLIVGYTGFLVGPLRRAGVMTIPEYYEMRFGRRVRILGGLLLAFAGILNMGLFLKAGSIFVTAITGLESAIAVKWVMTGLIGAGPAVRRRRWDGRGRDHRLHPVRGALGWSAGGLRPGVALGRVERGRLGGRAGSSKGRF